jgi:hypothetical protein
MVRHVRCTLISRLNATSPGAGPFLALHAAQEPADAALASAGRAIRATGHPLASTSSKRSAARLFSVHGGRELPARGLAGRGRARGRQLPCRRPSFVNSRPDVARPHFCDLPGACSQTDQYAEDLPSPNTAGRSGASTNQAAEMAPGRDTSRRRRRRDNGISGSMRALAYVVGMR